MNGNHLESAPKLGSHGALSSTRSKQRAVIARLSNVLRGRARQLSVTGTVVCACGILSLSLAIAVITHCVFDLVSPVVSQKFQGVRSTLVANEVAIQSLMSNARDARNGIPAVFEHVARTIRATDN